MYAAIVGCVAAFSALVLAATLLFPSQLLLVLGQKYVHLEHELLLMVLASILSALTGTVWSLNASKAWICGSWLYIPLTLAHAGGILSRFSTSPPCMASSFLILSPPPRIFFLTRSSAIAVFVGRLRSFLIE